jgi:hypothetical protein
MKLWNWFWSELSHLCFRKWMRNNDPDDTTWLVRSIAVNGFRDNPRWIKYYFNVFKHGNHRQ